LQSVVQGGNKELGTLYLKFETRTLIAEGLSVALEIGLAVMAAVLVIA